MYRERLTNIVSLNIFLMWLAFSPATFADEVEIAHSFYTKHIGGSENFNENLDFFIVRYNKYSAGTFINSYYIRSYLITTRWKQKELWSNDNVMFRGNVDYGLIHGYGDTPVFDVGGFTPIIYASVDTKFKNIEGYMFGLKVGYVPSGGGGVVTTFLSICKEF